MKNKQRCINCGQLLVRQNGVTVCPYCNTDAVSTPHPFIEPGESDEHIFIECPGATIYEEGTNRVIAGVEFLDDNDPSKGYRIVDHPVYAPTHTRRRRIKREALGKIRRCQGCQDLTVRLRRPEGPDFFIPSVKHPGRKKLKPAKYRSYA